MRQSSCKPPRLSDGGAFRLPPESSTQSESYTARRNTTTVRHFRGYKVHWLCVSQRVKHKCCLLIRKLLHGQPPIYMQQSCTTSTSLMSIGAQLFARQDTTTSPCRDLNQSSAIVPSLMLVPRRGTRCQMALRHRRIFVL